jgi:hypothetical protein
MTPAQLTTLEIICSVHTSSDQAAGELFYDLIRALQVDIEGVGNPADATQYLNREERDISEMFA